MCADLAGITCPTLVGVKGVGDGVIAGINGRAPRLGREGPGGAIAILEGTEPWIERSCDGAFEIAAGRSGPY